MDSPQYANSLSTVYNKQLNEVVLKFQLEYPVYQKPSGSDVDIIKTETAHSDICDLVIPEALARQMIDLLGKLLSQEQE